MPMNALTQKARRMTNKTVHQHITVQGIEKLLQRRETEIYNFFSSKE